MARFELIIDGALATFERWEDLPAVFDHVIRFEPDIPSAPHTPEQHAEASLWNDRLQSLMEVERARSNQDRRR